MSDKRDVWGHTTADYRRAQEAVRAALDGMSRPSRPEPDNSIDLLYFPPRSLEQAQADIRRQRAQRRWRGPSPAMREAVVRYHEQRADSCDLDDREEALHAANILARLDNGADDGDTC